MPSSCILTVDLKQSMQDLVKQKKEADMIIGRYTKKHGEIAAAFQNAEHDLSPQNS